MLSEIGQIIKFHRKKANLSMRKLSSYSGVSKTTINNYEKGLTHVRIDLLIKLLDVLNIHAHYVSPLMNSYARHKERVIDGIKPNDRLPSLDDTRHHKSE